MGSSKKNVLGYGQTGFRFAEKRFWDREKRFWAGGLENWFGGKSLPVWYSTVVLISVHGVPLTYGKMNKSEINK